MKKGVLNAAESQKIIKKYVKVPKSQVVKRFEKIKLKAPIVLKILSKEALHKTEIDGVKIVMDSASIKPAFEELLETAKKHKLKLDGIFVQEFVKGVEAIIGIKKDPVFGHMILFGLGGTMTEILKDTSTRRCPIELKDAEEMIDELRASKIFHEFRGMKVNTQKIKKALVSISKLVKSHKDIEELDINPFTVNGKDGFAVDVRVIKRK